MALPLLFRKHLHVGDAHCVTIECLRETLIALEGQWDCAVVGNAIRVVSIAVVVLAAGVLHFDLYTAVVRDGFGITSHLRLPAIAEARDASQARRAGARLRRRIPICRRALR